MQPYRTVRRPSRIMCIPDPLYSISCRVVPVLRTSSIGFACAEIKVHRARRYSLKIAGFSGCRVRSWELARSLLNQRRELPRYANKHKEPHCPATNEGVEMKNKFTKSIIKSSLGLLILMALIDGSSVSSFGQTRRRPRLRRYPRTVATTVVPSYYTIPANQILRVRMNSQISSESARVGDQFTTTVV